ncbi:MAG: hypothetical protein D6714_19320 [Bacteroidetes bacterium]|nr:MAG: hypothetical protein D6714_19320 [Bacteroidota bacterium]
MASKAGCPTKNALWLPETIIILFNSRLRFLFLSVYFAPVLVFTKSMEWFIILKINSTCQM